MVHDALLLYSYCFTQTKKKCSRKNVPACWWLLFWSFFVGFGLSSPKVALFQLFLKVGGKTTQLCGQLFKAKKENVLIEKNNNKGKSWKEKKKVTFVVVFEVWEEIVLFVLWRDNCLFEVNIFPGNFRQKNCNLMPKYLIFSLKILTVIPFRLLD